MKHLSAETLDLYLDGALGQAAQQAAAEHLAGCAGCRAELAAQQDLFTALSRVIDQRIPVDLTATVLQSVRRRQPLDGRAAALLLALEAVIAASLAVWLLPPLVGGSLPDLQALLTRLDLSTLIPPFIGVTWADWQASSDLITLRSAVGGWQVWLLALLISAAWLATTYLLLAGSRGVGRHEQEAV